MKKLLLVLFLIAFVAGLSFAQQNVSAPQKFALVIGNGNYTNIAKLNNPVNDANDVAAALQGLGFTVDKVLDANLEQMENAVMRLKNRLSASQSTYGFLFYAGHGVQSNGENYLIPVGANIPSENSLRERSVSVQWTLAELNDAKNALNVVVLDACRDNPFSWKRSSTRGLSMVANQPADSIIVYATSAGTAASDGTGRNGLFTTHLLNNLKTPGLEVKEIFNRTGADVARASNRAQIPAIYSQFFDTAYFGQRPATNTPVQPVPTPQLALVEQSVNAGNFEKAFANIKTAVPGFYTVTLTEDVTLTAGIDFSGFGTKTITVQGDSRMRTITRSFQGTLFTVPEYIVLILGNNITLAESSERIVVHSDGESWKEPAYRGSGVDVRRGGSFEMRDGSVIKDNSGCGVSVLGAFTMKGGTISGNKRTGVYVYGSYNLIDGTQTDFSGTFIMNGGTISGNSYNILSIMESGYGGVAVIKGTFTMNGGTISNNEDRGVGIDEGTFTMNGGTISGNNGGLYTGNDGGGVHVSSRGTFTMNDGTISGNGIYHISDSRSTFMGVTTVIKAGDPAGAGGGVSVEKSGTFIKTGGTIDGTNNAEKGKAVYYGDGKSVWVRNSAAGPSVNMDTRVSGKQGGWE